MGRTDPELMIEILSDGERIGSTPASLGFLEEEVLFRGILAGKLPNDGTLPELQITAHRSELDPRTIASLGISIDGAPGATYDRAVLSPQARSLIRELRRTHRLDPERVVEWRVTVAESPPEPRARFSVRTVRAPYPLIQRELSHVSPGAFETTVEAEVLRTIRQRMQRAGAVECAGLLFGEARYDPDRSAGELHVTGMVDAVAGRAGASRTHFSFDPEFFLGAVHQAAGEATGRTIAGWWHTHPPCEACPRHPECETETVFFSADDEDVHRAAFPAPFCVAIVGGKLRRLPATRPGFRLYGWQRACIVERPFRLGGGSERRESPDVPAGGNA